MLSQFTFMNFCSKVNFDVLWQVSFVNERYLTVNTRLWLYSQVNPHVALQWNFSGHMFVELKTFICPEIYIRFTWFLSTSMFFSFVHSIQVRMAGKWLTTFVTRKTSANMYDFSNHFCALNAKSQWIARSILMNITITIQGEKITNAMNVKAHL